MNIFDMFKTQPAAPGGAKMARVQPIRPQHARERLQNEKDLVLLDVRTPEEYREGHIPGSRLVPLQNLPAKVGDVVIDKNTPVNVYCRSGARSAQAASHLVRMGYQQVFDMGGIVSWPFEIKR